ncbi:hypothetical protein [Candidatus Chlorohelix sp.]|uniref:hypothetical protein n=1 Tax=Candidatus Chlorohelix sp. TaxID=3139201 RepID=UPI003039DAEF
MILRARINELERHQNRHKADNALCRCNSTYRSVIAVLNPNEPPEPLLCGECGKPPRMPIKCYLGIDIERV